MSRNHAIPTRSRVVLALMVIAVAINYVDRQVLSVALPAIRAEFDLSSVDYSRIVFTFLLAYSLAHPFAGRLLDVMGTRVGFALAVAFWSVACMLHALAGSVLAFAFFRFLLGVGEAAALPASVKAASEWFPASFRSMAVGIVNNGIGLGAIIAPPLCAWLLIAYGWRAAFLITGAVGVIWVVFWMPATRRLPVQTPDPVALGGQAPASVAGGRPQLAGLMIARFVSDPAWYFYLFWLPDYLYQVRGFSLVEIGAFAWIPYLAANGGALFGGWASGYLLRRGWRPVAARRTIMAASAILLPVGILVTAVDSAVVALTLISAAMFLIQVWATNLFTLPADIFAREHVGFAYGLSGAAGSAGAMLVTLIVGYVVELYSYTPILIVVSVMHPVALAITWTLIGHSAKPLKRDGAA